MIMITLALTRRIRQRCLGTERGQSLVEFAIVVPLFLAMVFGIVEFGAMMMNQIHVTRAADVGARAGSLKGSNATNAVAAVGTATSGLISCPAGTPTASYAGSPSVVTVTASCNYSPITPVGTIAGFVIPTAISRSIMMRVEN